MDNVFQENSYVATDEISLVQENSIIRSLMADDRPLAEILAEYETVASVIRELAKTDDELDKFIQFDDYGRLKGSSVAALRQFVNLVECPTEVGETPSTFRGIGGYQALVFFKAFLGRFVGEGDELCVKNGVVVPVCPEYRIKTSGKISDYLFIPGKQVSDVLWTENNGHLSVNVIDQEFCTNAELIACTPTRTKLYHWDIELKNCEVHKRDDGRFLDSDIEKRKRPFPGIIEPSLPPHSVDPDDGRSIWCRCLDHKIYAVGDQIAIHNIYCSQEDGSLVRLEDGHFLYGEIDETDKTDEAKKNMSCVDLMFRGFPPAIKLPPQIEYCLGRCAHPPIVNTGGG